MSNQTDHTIVRLRVPPELKEKIEKAAEENNRSQSAEMVSRLEDSFETHSSDNKFGDPEFRKKLEKSFEITAKIFEGLEKGTIEIKHKDKE